MSVLKAEELKIGCQIEDADGVLFDVREIVRETANTITIRMCSDESPYEDYHTKKRDGTNGGVIRTYYKVSLLIGNLPEKRVPVRTDTYEEEHLPDENEEIIEPFGEFAEQDNAEQEEPLPEEMKSEALPELAEKLTFYAAGDADFMLNREDDLTLPEAVKQYNEYVNAHLNGVPVIGFTYEDGGTSIYDKTTCDILSGGKVLFDDVNAIDQFKNSPVVQDALKQMQDMAERGLVAGVKQETPLTHAELVFLNTDIGKTVAKQFLAWDEVESLGYVFYEDGYIDRHRPHDKVLFGDGCVPEHEIYNMADKMRNGEDIREELAKALVGDTANAYDIGAYKASAEFAKEQITVSYKNAEKVLSYEELGDAFLRLVQSEYLDVTKTREEEQAEKTGIEPSSEPEKNQPEPHMLRITIGKGLVGKPFTTANGYTHCQVKIPNADKDSKDKWATFLVDADTVHMNENGKSVYFDLPKNGETAVTEYHAAETDENGKNRYDRKTVHVPNARLKGMLEAYKKAPVQAKKEVHHGKSR